MANRNVALDPDVMRQKAEGITKERKAAITLEEKARKEKYDQRMQLIKELLQSDPVKVDALFEELEIRWSDNWVAFRNHYSDEYRYFQGRLDALESVMEFLADKIGRKIELKVIREPKAKT